MTQPASSAATTPDLTPDLDDGVTSRFATGQTIPAPPSDPRRADEADAMLSAAVSDARPADGSDAADGTHDPYRQP